MKISLVQLNPVVGDVVGNVEKIRETYFEADERGIDLVVLPELSVTGYPLEDMVSSGDLLDAAAAALDVLRNATRGRNAALLVGAPVRVESGDNNLVHNSALIFAGGETLGEARKKSRPDYGLFDEKRNFQPETNPLRPIEVKGRRLGVLICEDAWTPGPAAELKAAGADAFVCVNASPYRPNALETRVRDVAAQRVAENGLPFAYVNQVGGQDELVFDGGSFLMDAKGRCVIQSPQWESAVVDSDLDAVADGSLQFRFQDPREEVWRAMMLSLTDYTSKSGFTDVVLGLSGGLDSAVVAAVAGDALGAEHVHCVRLPSRYTSDLSNNSAEEMCRVWGFDMKTVAIGPVVDAATDSVGKALDGHELGKLTRENMQARARGFLLMTLSNEFNWLLLSTGNKSEIAVGYATLYGDMCGGFNPLKDVFKTTAYSVARWRNQNRPAGLRGPEGVAIPVEIIERQPSAELSPGQLDTDSLPPYPILDAILHEMVEKRTPVSRIHEKGYEPALVQRIHKMLKRAEYKRRQGAPGPKTSDRSFARERRMPIINGFSTAQVLELREMADNNK